MVTIDRYNHMCGSLIGVLHIVLSFYRYSESKTLGAIILGFKIHVLIYDNLTLNNIAFHV